MTPPPLEDRLNRLADHLAAPATPDARHAIGRRAATLRRRRQVRNAVGSGLLALLIVAGALVLRIDDPADVELEPAGPAPGSLPALTVDLDGWRIVAAEETTTTPGTGDTYDPASGSLQVFRRPGDLAGPSVFLHHQAASDAIVADPAAQPVVIAGSEGYLHQTGPESFTVRWTPPVGDSQAYLEARGLTRNEVIQFANGLEVKDDAIRYPPAPDEKFGFVAGKLPGGIQEDPVSATNPGGPAVRRLVLERARATADVAIDDRGEAAFEAYLGELLGSDSVVEEVSVMDHPAVLVERPDSGRWSLVWQQTDEATVIASLTGVGRSTVDDFVGSLREISESEWRDLVAAHRDAAAPEPTIAVP
jgi:hypothetical protein